MDIASVLIFFLVTALDYDIFLRVRQPIQRRRTDISLNFKVTVAPVKFAAKQFLISS